MSEQQVYCLTHVDMDGHASAAIVKSKYPDAIVYYMNYGKPLRCQLAPNSLIFVTDFCFEPVGEMLNLATNHTLVWIDHHATAIKAMEEAGCNPPGIRRDGTAACELTWEYIYPDKPVPRAIRLLADYDVWKLKENPDAEPFQCGTNLYDLRPFDNNMWIWQNILADGPIVDLIMTQGREAFQFITKKNRLMSEDMAFRATIAGKQCLCANIGGVNSKFFENCDITDIDALMTFGYSGTSGKWRFSIYCPEGKDTDVGQIAYKMGGGGHRSAAGWNSQTLPFVRPDTFSNELPIVPVNDWPAEMKTCKISSAIAYTSLVSTSDIGMFSCMFRTIWKEKNVLAVNSPCFDQELAYRLFSKYNRLGEQNSDFGKPVDGILFFYMTKEMAWRYVYIDINYNPNKTSDICSDEGWYEYDTNISVSIKYNPELPFLLTKFNRFGY